MDTAPRTYHIARLSNGTLIPHDVTGFNIGDAITAGIREVEGFGHITHDVYIVADDEAEAMAIAQEGFSHLNTEATA